MTADAAVEEVFKLRPESGDVVVLRLARAADAAAMRRLAETARAALPDGVRVVIADEGITDVQLHKQVDALLTGT